MSYGCAVGAGVTGDSVFALTACRVLGGVARDWAHDRAGTPQPQQAAGSPRNERVIGYFVVC